MSKVSEHTFYKFVKYDEEGNLYTPVDPFYLRLSTLREDSNYTVWVPGEWVEIPEKDRRITICARGVLHALPSKRAILEYGRFSVIFPLSPKNLKRAKVQLWTAQLDYIVDFEPYTRSWRYADKVSAHRMRILERVI